MFHSIAPSESGQAAEESKERRWLGDFWKVSDAALWNPFEVAALLAGIVFVFGFVLGQGKYAFVAELFSPVIFLAVSIVFYQSIARYIAGEASSLAMLKDRMR